MPLHLTKIAFGAQNYADIAGWFENRSDMRLNTRYKPTRDTELAGGSLYWIQEHMLVARSPILGFAQAPDGRWWIELAPELIRVHPRPKRAHQGWRYLKDSDAPADVAPGEEPQAALPGPLAGRLAKLGLI